MNRNIVNVILATAGIFLVTTGCNLQLMQPSLGKQTVDVLADTALHQTLAFSPQITVKTSEPALLPTNTATLQPTPTFTPTITLTPTLEKVMVKVSKNTNCREGPDKYFDLVGIMKVGETAEAIGRNADKTYWVIRLPANTAKTCWLWYEWATLTGNGDALPVVESPPTPTWSPKPDFTFSYVGIGSCPAPKIIRLQIVNTGNITWESWRVHTKDLDTAVDANVSSDGFENGSDPGCAAPSPIPAIGPGETAYAVGIVAPVTSGHTIVVTVTLYAGNGGTGTHITGDFSFTMP
jgi:hypothetical protein